MLESYKFVHIFVVDEIINSPVKRNDYIAEMRVCKII